MRRLMITAVVMLAGCASTPQEVIERGSQHSRTFSNPPGQVGACIDRKAEGLSAAYVVRHRPLDDGVEEVYVRIMSDPPQALAVFRVAADRTAKIWVNPGLFEAHEAWIDRISGGC